MKMSAKLEGIHWIVDCSMCSMGLKVEVVRSITKTYYQVIEDFNKIPLTESQRGTKKLKPKPKLKV